MLLVLLLGFLLGVAAVIAAEASAFFLVLARLRRRRRQPTTETEGSRRDLDAEESIAFLRNKQGTVWVLESEKIPKVVQNESPTKGLKEQKKETIEVFPVKKYAKIKGHSLVLSDLDGSQATIGLLDCTVAAVSASNLYSRKWAKRYPIKLQSKDSLIYIYLDTSWEKESWCKALRLASCPSQDRSNWYAEMNEEFRQYLAKLNTEYPSFLKPSTLVYEATEKTNRVDGSSSRVRGFLKKLAKKAAKTGVEYRISSVSSSTHGDRKALRSSSDAMASSGFSRTVADKSSSNSLPDLVQPFPSSSSNLGYTWSLPENSEVYNEKFTGDEGTLCWNLLFSRIFFDARRSKELNNAIKARIQRTLSNMRTPSYVGGVTCTAVDLGNLPPHMRNMRVLPMDMNEVWSVEVDIEYFGGIVIDIETRLEVREPELQKGIINTAIEPSSSGEVNSDLLESIEYYGNQLKLSGSSADHVENRDEEEKIDGLKQSKSTSWTSAYVSRWKAIVNSIADQVSQVPLSLTIRFASLRGTLCLRVKRPPSDQLWFGFTSMPEIDWIMESSVGDRKITSGHIATLVGNRLKSAIRESLVLPNSEYICIPWMLAEKDDWVPRKVAPFVWLNQETMDPAEVEMPNSQPDGDEIRLDGGSSAKAVPAASPDKTIEEVKNVVNDRQPSQETNSDVSRAPSVAPRSSSHPTQSRKRDELKVPLLRSETVQEGCEKNGESPEAPASKSITISDEQKLIPVEDDTKPKKVGTRARMMDLGKKMGEKLEEKKRHLEEKSRHIVGKMRENAR